MFNVAAICYIVVNLDRQLGSSDGANAAIKLLRSGYPGLNNTKFALNVSGRWTPK